MFLLDISLYNSHLLIIFVVGAVCLADEVEFEVENVSLFVH
jgi:hypothetical protein